MYDMFLNDRRRTFGVGTGFWATLLLRFEFPNVISLLVRLGQDPDHGSVMQLQGDIRKEAKSFSRDLILEVHQVDQG